MKTTLTNSYLENYPVMESLILSLEYDTEKRQVELVYDYAAEVVSQYFESRLNNKPIPTLPRDFRRILFFEVDSVTVSNRYIKKNTNPLEVLQEKIISATMSLQNAVLSNHGKQKKLILSIDSCFTLQIVFRKSEVTQRLCRNEQTSESDWQYYDNTTGEKVDFNRPFNHGL